MAVTVNSVAISEALPKGKLSVKVPSTTSRAIGDILVCNQEACLVNRVDTANNILGLQRGYLGTREADHPSGALAYVDQPGYFADEAAVLGTAVAADAVAQPAILIGGGQRAIRAYRILNDSWVEIGVGRTANFMAVDPDTGYEYTLVDCQSSFQIGEWVVLDGDGLATQLGTSSKGRVAIIVETVAASDTVAWAIRKGTFAAALLTSGVTTACVLKAGTGCGDISTSAGGNVIMNATCTVAPSTATSPTVGDGVGTVILDDPFVYGITTDIVP